VRKRQVELKVSVRCWERVLPLPFGRNSGN
jgi:hypothetical protein